MATFAFLYEYTPDIGRSDKWLSSYEICYIGKIEGRSEWTKNGVSNLTIILMGNGQAGFWERTVRVEENLEELAENQKENAELVREVAKSVKELKEIMDGHIGNSEKHNLKEMVLKKEVILFGILFVVAVSSL